MAQRRWPTTIRAAWFATAGLCVLAGLGLGWAGRRAAAAGDVYVLDVRGEQALVLLLPERQLALRSGGQMTPLGTTAIAARFLPGGDIAVVDDELALKRIETAELADWLPPGSANGPLFVSPDGHYLAFLKPDDIAGYDEVALPLTNGIAVLDLAQAGASPQVLLSIPGTTLNLYGWLGSQLLIEAPGAAGPMQLATLAVGEAAPVPQPYAALPGLNAGAGYPQTSFDQRFLAYEADGGVVVAEPASGTYALLAGESAPRWTEAGLTAERAGARAAVYWAEADLSQTAESPGPLRLPAAVDFSASTAPPEGAPAAPSEANAILIYRPVSAATRVSAYFDLDPLPNSIRDWTGWVGTTWVSGHAYDGHRGTDYANVIGTPIYASQVGTIYAVSTSTCVNTFPGGPASFGSYVMVAHGRLADGLYYWTLYGHLKCDAVYVSEGQPVPVLPQQVAQMGNTGWSTGPHTHLQVYRSGANSYSGSTTVDPYNLRIISDNPPTVPPPRTTGDLVGTVRDPQGTPVAGASLKLMLGGTIYAVTTGPTGSYQFLDMPPGTASLSAVAGARWGAWSGSLQAAQVQSSDLVLDRCVGQVTAAGGCPALQYDAAAYVSDVNYPDGTPAAPGQALVKTWRLRNTGNVPWGPGYQLVLVAGTLAGDAPVAAVDVPAMGPDVTADISVAMTASSAPGRHRSYWRLRSPAGFYFGPTVWVDLDTQAAPLVAGLPTPAAGADGVYSPDAPTCSATAPATSGSAKFTVNWSAGGSIAAYDVQVQDSGRDPWRDWITSSPGSQTSAEFSGLAGHHYGFRCRATDTSNATGSYPGGADATTLVGPGSGQADLRLQSLTAQPAPGGGLIATMVIENAGSQGTQRGFYVDLYRDRQPTGVGDLTNSVSAWYSPPLAAGATVTLKGGLSAPPGNPTLYAQVDSSGVINDPNRSNNIWGAGVSGCLAAEDAFENDDTPPGAAVLAAGTSQARNFGGPGDQDWIRVNLTAGHTYRVTTSGLGPSADTQVAAFDAAGTYMLSFNDDSSATSLASFLLVAARGDGNGLLRVSNWNPALGGCGADYTISLTDLGLIPAHFFPFVGR